MARPRLSIVVPTVGRGNLEQLIASLAWQMTGRDECLILGDVASGPLPDVEAQVAALDQRFRYLPLSAGHHCYGHCNLNAGMREARGDYLVFNDDDDVFVAGALASIRGAIEELTEPRPLLFRFVTHYGFTVWHDRAINPGHIGGHCIVPPNIPERFGMWTCRYEGDYDFVESTVEQYPSGPVWREEIIAIARPVFSREAAQEQVA